MTPEEEEAWETLRRCGYNFALSDVEYACKELDHPELTEENDSINFHLWADNAKQAKRRREARIKHPCTHRINGQRCQLGGGCEFSPTKAAANCKRGFKQKKNWKKGTVK